MYIGLSVQLHGLPDDTGLEEVVRVVKGQLREWLDLDSMDVQVDIEETAGGSKETPPV